MSAPVSKERLDEIRANRYQVRSLAAADVDITDLLAEVTRLRALLHDVQRNAQKLVSGWKQSSEDHAAFAKSAVIDGIPGMADKQEGRSLQLLDCADELADVLKGEDPDEWEYGVGVDVLNRDERAAEAGDPS